MKIKFKIISLFLVVYIMILTLFCGNHSGIYCMAGNLGKETLFQGFSGGFYLVKNTDKYTSCISIKSNGDETEIFHQSGYKITNLTTSRSYLYLLVEDDNCKIIFKLFRDGSIKSTYAIDFDITASIVAATDNNLYFINDNSIVIEVNQSLNTSEKITLSKNIYNLFCYKENIYAITDNSIVSIKSPNKYINSDIPEFLNVNSLSFYDNICIDNNGKVYSFNEDSGFKYIKSYNSKKCFMLNNTYCTADGNTLYSFSDDGVKVGKYSCYENIDDVCANENKAVLLISGQVYIITLKNFTNIDNSNSTNDSNSNTDVSSDEKTSSNINYNSNTLWDLGGYKTDGDYILIEEGTTIAAMKKKIYTALNVRQEFHDNNGKLQTSGKLGTGYSLEFYKDNLIKKKYTIIVKGDITGEGSINTRDTKKLTESLLEQCNLSDAERYSADFDENNTIDSLDLLLLKQNIG